MASLLRFWLWRGRKMALRKPKKKRVLDTLGKTYQTEDCPGRGVNLGSFRFRCCSLPMQRLRPHGYCACSFWFSPPLMPKSLKKDNFFLLGWRFWWILECLSPRSRPSRTMLFFLPVDFVDVNIVSAISGRLWMYLNNPQPSQYWHSSYLWFHVMSRTTLLPIISFIKEAAKKNKAK